MPDTPAMIGRDSRQIPVTDNTVSRKHAELLPENGDWIVKDNGSANGTYVNGQRVEKRAVLKLGDQVRVGRTIMVFGAQPGVSRANMGNVTLAGEEAGMDSAIMHSIPSSEDSMVMAVPDPSAAAVTNLKILYQLNASLGSGFSTDQVLELVMDLVFEHVQADRGIILLTGQRGDLIPRVARTREEQERKKKVEKGKAKPGGPEEDEEEDEEPTRIHASRTIINHVMQTGEGVLSSNAMADRRFTKGKSVHNLGIRSALCVPIKLRRYGEKGGEGEEIAGVIYIDSSVKNYTYSPDQLRLLTAIGFQAGLAIQNARLYQQALQGERMSAIGETVAALSHSIKNILQALRGGADVVEMGFRNSNVPQAHKGWRIVDRNLEKIYNLTMNLLAYSRPREPKLEAVNPKALIAECVELVATTANDRGVMVVADVDPDQPPVPLDSDGMHQVLMNLLSNALDAVKPQEGLIRVVCRYDASDNHCVIEVVDNGSGIEPSMMNHMFELFHSTKGNRGTGLGLAVAKKIVDEHEGTISVRSKAGEGTTFSVRLPVYAGEFSDPSHTHGPR